MDKRYAEFWVRLSILLVSLFAGGAGLGASNVVITGKVTFEDTGEPVRGASVVITELRARPFMMPRPIELAVKATDDDGRFLAELGRVRGDLDVGLFDVPCERTGDVVSITQRELKASPEFHIELTVARLACDAPPETP